MSSGYLDSPWPAEDAGPQRLQAPRRGAGLALRPGESLRCTTRNTLMSTMTVLGAPGEVYLLTHSALRSRIGVLPQDALLPAGEKVGEFMLYLGRLQGLSAFEAEKSARAVLAEVEGLDWWNTKCGALSHGMAKRVSMAQALMGSPPVIFLDEPTAGLDPKIAASVPTYRGRRGKRGRHGSAFD